MKQEAKHSPAPWWVEGQNILSDKTNHIGIAKVYGNVGQPREDNARLIALAPLLPEAIEALKTIRNDCDSLLNDEMDSLTDREIWHAFLNLILPVIAKYEGKEK